MVKLSNALDVSLDYLLKKVKSHGTAKYQQ